jgi:transposase-like protein
MNAQDQKIIAHTYSAKEGFINTYPWFLSLKQKGLAPQYITMDGEKSVIMAIKLAWPKAKIQRCLWHIQREGMRWLRTYPKTQAGRDLRYLLMTLCRIQSEKERNIFVKQYQKWLRQYKKFVMSLPSSTVAFKDLKKAMTLIKNALPNMFHFLKDPNVHSTTNALESFYSRLKADYQRHRGLTEHHKIHYLNWYCYFKNGLN